MLDSYGDTVVYAHTLGRSMENQPLVAYVLMLGATPETYQAEMVQRNSMFTNGAHHAREVTTISQTVFSMLMMLYDYEVGDQSTIDLLTKNAYIFMPIVNIDGFTGIDIIYGATGELEVIRKNRRFTSADCDVVTLGVDLNRNYSFKWAYDDIGSSDNPCDQDYRGSEPFSEPETQAIRDMLVEMPNMKIAFNMHATGPLWIHPFCFDTSPENPLLTEDFPNAKAFYRHLTSNIGLSDSWKVGNAI